jgi:hypothetical protein
MGTFILDGAIVAIDCDKAMTSVFTVAEAAPAQRPHEPGRNAPRPHSGRFRPRADITVMRLNICPRTERKRTLIARSACHRIDIFLT